jgi:anti-anti-sigma regulatory factor
MRRDDEGKARKVQNHLQDRIDQAAESHVVFDFTGLEEPDVCDLSLILTARLQAAPTDSVWVRSLPWQTARVLRILRLDHLFRQYPTGADDLN